MDKLTFISQVTTALAWPVTTLLCVLLLRGFITALLPLLRKLNAGAISDRQYDLLSRRRRLANEAERAPVDSISPDSAAEYVGSALRFAASLEP